MKSRVLVDFVAEMTIENKVIGARHEEGYWILNVDGLSDTKGSGVGVILKSPTGESIE